MPTAIPASEPVTAQISFTVTSSTISLLMSGAGILGAIGTNLTAVNRSMSFKILKNSVSISTGIQNCRASENWEFRLRNLTGLTNGDLLSVKFWCADASWLELNTDYLSDGSGNFATIQQAAAFAIALGG